MDIGGLLIFISDDVYNLIISFRVWGVLVVSVYWCRVSRIFL